MNKYLCILIMLFLTFISCKDKIVVKPMNYNKDGVNFECDSYFMKDSLFKIYCFNKKRDTLLKEFYKNNLMHGMSTEYYDNGIIKRQGNYYQNEQIGTWFEYYADGILKQRRRYVVGVDSFNIIYEKNYNPLGELSTVIYPIKKSIDKQTYKRNDTIKFNLELEYSEFDNVFIAAIVNCTETNKVDTLISDNNELEYRFITEESGEHKLYGTLYEYNKEFGQSEEGFGGSRDFVINYIVK